MSIRGLDVSYCQEGIKWDAVKDYAYQFIIIRAGNDMKNRYDTLFEDNIKECIKRGFDIGIYWHALACTPDQAATEARWCIEKINAWRDHITLPVYYDLEVANVLYQPNVSEIVDAFRSVIKENGFRTGLYCSTGWITMIKQDVIDKFESVWIAEWGNKCTYKGSYDIWQNGRTPTFGGTAADEDIMVRDIIENRQYMRDLQPLREGVELIRKTSERLEKLLSEGK